MGWTESQLEAIENRGSNLLVSAAAGSGKTAVLVERIINMILKDKVDIDRLLIVTFTNAAAGEMRERILLALMKKLEEKSDDNENILRQIGLLNKASITTVHSFCINVIRKNFHFIDLDPNFRIADTTESKILIQESLEELLEDEYGKEDENFIGLVESFSEDKGDLKIESLILKIYLFIQSQPYPLKWLREKAELYNLDKREFLKSDWISTITEELEEELKVCEKVLKKAVALTEKDEKLSEKYKATLLEDMESLKDLEKKLENREFEELQRAIAEIKHGKLSSVKKSETDEELKLKVQSFRNEYKEIIKKLKAGVFKKEIDEYVKEVNGMYPVIEYLYLLVESFTERYDEKKRDRGILDFNDLEHFTLAILEHEEVRESLREKYEYIFVDEYQDSNIVQETIIDKIRKDDNLFLVGDVKQSIYRFRLADPTLFIEKYFDYNLPENNLSKRIDLSKNFRSRKEIIDGVNFIFKQLMSERLGEIDYSDDSYLYAGSEYEDIYDNSIELNIIDKKAEAEEVEVEAPEETQDELSDMQTAEVEAHFIAEKIKRLINEKTYDAKKGQYRKIDYKDIVILLRTMKNWASVYEEVFIKEGIPIYTDDSSGYFEAMEVKIFLNLLSVIDNRKQDIPLLSVMRSPIGNFELEELISVRIHDKTGTYYEAIDKYIEEKDDLLSEKLESFMEKISKWKRESKYYKLDEFIWKLLVETNYSNYVGGLSNGEQRQANLRMLVDRANEFEKASINGLFNFIRFADKLKDISGDMGTAKTIGESENVVRVMSIHKSKGLEFPVVICGGLGKQFNASDSREEIVLHKDLGIGTKFVDIEKRRYNSSLPELAIKKKIAVENLSEELRILYVAFTRAKDKLVLYGTVNGIDKSMEKWIKGVDVHRLLSSKSFLDWICLALSNHPASFELFNLSEDEILESKEEKDQSLWKVNFLKKAEILDIKKKEKSDKKGKSEILLSYESDKSNSVWREIERRFSWKYGFEEDTATPSKVSVTYLKNLEAGKENDIAIPELVEYPDFVKEKKESSGAEKGTLNHRILELVPFDRVWTKDDLEDYIESLIEREIIKREEKSEIDYIGIQSFFQTKVYKRILNSGKVKKEQPFVYARKSPKEMYIQGIIDCYFEEDGRLVLLDYKTDRIGEEELLRRYKHQIELYRESLQKITGKEVANSYIYSLNHRREIEV